MVLCRGLTSAPIAVLCLSALRHHSRPIHASSVLWLQCHVLANSFSCSHRVFLCKDIPLCQANECFGQMLDGTIEKKKRNARQAGCILLFFCPTLAVRGRHFGTPNKANVWRVPRVPSLENIVLDMVFNSYQDIYKLNKKKTLWYFVEAFPPLVKSEATTCVYMSDCMHIGIAHGQLDRGVPVAEQRSVPRYLSLQMRDQVQAWPRLQFKLGGD